MFLLWMPKILKLNPVGLVVDRLRYTAMSEKGVHLSLTLSKYKWKRIMRFLRTGKLKK